MSEPHLFVRCLEESADVDLGATGRAAVYSARSPVKTTDNEDAALVLPLGDASAILAVADGAGGHPAGEEASAVALESLRDTALETHGAGGSIRDAVLTGFDRANQAVLGLGSGTATTLVAVTVEERTVRVYHVGDSGALVFGGRGLLRLETIPHSPVGYGVEAGLIREEDALAHADRHLVSNVVGYEEMHIGVSSPLELKARDRVLLACDGLFDNVPVDEIVEALRSGPLLERGCSLAVTCRERMVQGGHPDDLTLLAFQPAD